MNGYVLPKKKKKFKFNLLFCVVTIILTLWCLSMVACLFWLLNNSVKSGLEYEWSQVTLAKEPMKYIRNYIDAWQEINVKGNDLVDMLFNTLWMTFGNISLALISSLTFSYIVARYKFPGRNLIYWVVIVRMMLVTVGTLPATYRLYDALHLTNSPLILITNLHGVVSFLIYYTAFKGISREFAESAFVDGAGHFRVFVNIMLPHVSGIVIATSISSFIANWNEYMTYILFMDKYPSIAAGIYFFKLANELDNYPIILAAVVMSIIPVVILFATFQKQFINIDLSGGLKG